MSKPITDSEIIENVMTALNTNANSLASDLNYASHMSIYHIVKGTNSISKGLTERIVQKFPNVNYNYMTRGEGSVLLNEEETKSQMNVFNIPGKQNDVEVFFKKFANSPDQLNRIESKVDKIFKHFGLDKED
jgi:plasmid maintenance system antidote protein VapI